MGRRLLLVEGKDDEHVVKHLCRAHRIEVETRFSIEQPKGDRSRMESDEGGVEQLLDQVPIRLKESDIERLAVILDADADAGNRWIQLRDRLRRAGIPAVPDQPAAEGTIVEFHNEFNELVRLGVWIMPDNRLPGMLENFLAFLVPENDMLLPHVDQFIAGIPSSTRAFPDYAVPKARIHAYLAVQEQPGKPMGLAITFRYLDAKREFVQPFLNWLQAVLVT
jgi:hypothetical protein